MRVLRRNLPSNGIIYSFTLCHQKVSSPSELWFTGELLDQLAFITIPHLTAWVEAWLGV